MTQRNGLIKGLVRKGRLSPVVLFLGSTVSEDRCGIVVVVVVVVVDDDVDDAVCNNRQVVRRSILPWRIATHRLR